MDNQNNQNNLNASGWEQSPQQDGTPVPQGNPVYTQQGGAAPQGAPAYNPQNGAAPQGAPVYIPQDGAAPQGMPVYTPQSGAVPPGTPAPAPQGGKNKKMIIIIAVAAVVVIAGIVCAIIFLGGDKSETDKITATSGSTTAAQTTKNANREDSNSEQKTTGAKNTTTEKDDNSGFSYSDSSGPISAVKMMFEAIETKDVDLYMRAIVGTGSYKDKILSNTSMTESELKDNVKNEVDRTYEDAKSKYAIGFDLDVKALDQTKWSQSRLDDFADLRGVTPTEGYDVEIQEYVNGNAVETQTLSVVQIDGEWIVLVDDD